MPPSEVYLSALRFLIVLLVRALGQTSAATDTGSKLCCLFVLLNVQIDSQFTVIPNISTFLYLSKKKFEATG